MNRTNSKFSVKNLVLGALFLALALVLPFFTGQIPQIGAMLCPMHLPILLAGFVCGGPVGAVVGFIAPLLRMVMFGMPPFYVAIAMAFELLTYGLVSADDQENTDHALSQHRKGLSQRIRIQHNAHLLNSPSGTESGRLPPPRQSDRKR